MVIKTGRRVSSLEVDNGDSDTPDELRASPSVQSNSNNRSISGQPSNYVIPVDYSFGNSPIQNQHHSQDGVHINAQNRHGQRNNSENKDSQRDTKVTLKSNCKDGDMSGRESLSDKDSIIKHHSKLQNNEQKSNSPDDISMTVSSLNTMHNNKLSDSSGQKRLALSPPLSSSSVVFPSSPESYNDIKRASQQMISPNSSDRDSLIHNRRNHKTDKHHKNTTNDREDGEIIDSDDDEREEGEIFGSKADLQLHTQIHMREAKPYKCTQCNKSFANSSYLSQHTRIHLGIKPYKCEICQRKFTQLSHLQQHIRTHTGDKPYKCRHPGCTKAFSQLSNLQSHSRCHQTDKPYKCNSCYKCFVDETALLEHIPKHKESKHLKTHICQYCGKSYTQETYLAKHMQKHSDRKEPRAPIGQMGGTNGTSGQANGQTNGNNGVSSGGGNALSALGSATSTSSVSQSVVDSYWQKVDPAAYAAHAAHHDRSGDYLGMADPRLNPHAAHQAAAQAVAARDMDMQRDMDAMRHAQLTGGYGDPGGAGVAKTSSAFSPIQGSMLQTAAAAQAAQGFAMSAGSRGYSFYDPIGFPKHHSQVGFDSKPGVGGANCFPNQLISLSQIRNYAHQPELLHSLKEK